MHHSRFCVPYSYRYNVVTEVTARTCQLLVGLSNDHWKIVLWNSKWLNWNAYMWTFCKHMLEKYIFGACWLSSVCLLSIANVDNISSNGSMPLLTGCQLQSCCGSLFNMIICKRQLSLCHFITARILPVLVCCCFTLLISNHWNGTVLYWHSSVLQTYFKYCINYLFN